MCNVYRQLLISYTLDMKWKGILIQLHSSVHINGLAQDCVNFIAYALKMPQSCAKPLKCTHICMCVHGCSLYFNSLNVTRFHQILLALQNDKGVCSHWQPEINFIWSWVQSTKVVANTAIIWLKERNTWKITGFPSVDINVSVDVPAHRTWCWGICSHRDDITFVPY